MTSSTIDSQPYLNVLTQASAAYRGEIKERPAPKTVTAALIKAELAAKQQRKTFSLTELAGRWRLCFTAPRKAHQTSGQTKSQGLYVPKFIPAYISLTPENVEGAIGQGAIANQLQIGFVQIKLTGPFKYPGKKNLLGFDFTHAEFLVLGKALYKGGFQSGKAAKAPFESQPVAKLPFFAFFLATEDFIAARGRGGGLALWVRES